MSIAQCRDLGFNAAVYGLGSGKHLSYLLHVRQPGCPRGGVMLLLGEGECRSGHAHTAGVVLRAVKPGNSGVTNGQHAP